jgi:multidrug resistance efflux pump
VTHWLRLDSRPFRLLLTLVIIVVLTSVFAERALYRTSIEAVVNAPRVQVLAPIDGTVDTVGTTLGEAVRAGDLLVRVRRDAWSATGEGDVGNRVALLRDRIDIVARQLATLVEMQEALAVRSARYRQTAVVRLEANVQAADARAHERTLALAQAEALRKVDGIPQSDLERTRAETAVAVAEAQRLRAALRSARAGIVVDESGQDAPYSQQRLDQLTIDVARLRAERDAMKVELAALRMGTVGVADTATPVVSLSAPTAGVVWTVPAAIGERVLKGTPVATLVDCSRVYLEASVTPYDGDRIVPGTAVLVHFAGRSREYKARVLTVRGGGLRPEGDAAAQLLTPNRDGDAKVIVSIDPASIEQTAGNFCQVGRQAKIIFAEHAPLRPLSILSRWLD